MQQGPQDSTILNSLADPLLVLDVRTYQIIFRNQAADAVYGPPKPGYETCHALTHDRDSPCEGPEHQCPLADILATGESKWVEHIHVDQHGEARYFLVQSAPLRDEEQNVRWIAEVHTDITNVKSEEALLSQTFETSQATLITDEHGTIVRANQAVTRLTGFDSDDLVGGSLDTLLAANQPRAEKTAIWQTFKEEGTWSGEVQGITADGSAASHWLLSITAVTDHRDHFSHSVVVIADISELRHYQQLLEHQAFHDDLTDLPNRALFEDRLTRALNRAYRRNESLAVVFLGLDQFKDINDSLGHAAGDKVLQAVASRVSGVLPAEDTVARFGGDELHILLESGVQAEQVWAVAGHIQETLEAPLIIEGQELHISGSIGISFYPHDGGTKEELIRNANAALYAAKSAGRNTIRACSSEIAERARHRLAMSTALREAFNQSQFILHYQPQLAIATQTLSGMEALVRWQHPEEGLLGPDRFIPHAEELGLIQSLGEYVLHQACQQGRTWLDAGHAIGRIAVNISGQQVAEGDLDTRTANALRDTGFPAENLELEVTESALVEPTEHVMASLQNLRRMGVTLAIDDFGTGYSSLSYLQSLPIERLKIDKGFVQGIEASQQSAGIVRAILSMGGSLELEIVAEGVETEYQRAFLKREGGHVEQGFLHARPLPPSDMEAEFRLSG